jgi:putative transposase
LLCEALGVSRGGFYAWITRPKSNRVRLDEVISPHVCQSFVASDRTYGARRILKDMLELGHRCGLHKIERLMKAQALLRARPRRRAKPIDRGDRLPSAIGSNLLDRQFVADAPNKKWVADFTYIWTAEGWLYVAAVLVIDALMMAIWRRGKPESLLHHSDQGSQYTSDQFQRLLTEQGITCSMSRAGEVWDNSAMESFFSTLKIERVNRRGVYKTRQEAKADVFDYIECFYNPRRRHSTIGYVSPVNFESMQYA